MSLRSFGNSQDKILKNASSKFVGGVLVFIDTVWCSIDTGSWNRGWPCFKNKFLNFLLYWLTGVKPVRWGTWANKDVYFGWIHALLEWCKEGCFTTSAGSSRLLFHFKKFFTKTIFESNSSKRIEKRLCMHALLLFFLSKYCF